MTRRLSVALLALALACAPAAAHQIKAGALVIHHPWTRATPASAPVGGGYTVIENTGATPDTLVGGTFAPASGFEIHSMAMENGVMAMRAVPDGVVIPPHGKVAFAPGGGLHLMFPGLRERLVEGEEVEGTLVFRNAGTVKVEYEVQGIASKSAADGHDMAGHADMPAQ